jgi:cobalt-precorrin-5B (C1)-methyltransferase
MDEAAMELFCREHQIRLLIDAAHPFAERLHATIAAVAAALQLPIVRYDRIYPPHESDIHWCRDYDDAIRQLEAAGIDRLLMLTGVQTIARLKPFWQHHDCWCRILDRDSSRALAVKNGFPEKKLAYYEHSDIPTLLAQLRPQAIITKESGLSGGFKEKVEAAREAGVEIFVVERPLSNSPRGGEDSLSSCEQEATGLAALPPTGGAGRGASISKCATIIAA